MNNVDKMTLGMVKTIEVTNAISEWIANNAATLAELADLRKRAVEASVTSPLTTGLSISYCDSYAQICHDTLAHCRHMLAVIGRPDGFDDPVKELEDAMERIRSCQEAVKQLMARTRLAMNAATQQRGKVQ